MRKEILLEKQKMSGGSTAEDNIRKNQQRKNSLVKTGGWIMFLSVVLVLVSSIISVNIAKSKGEIPNILGFNLFVVESGSMEPTLNIGSVILCRKFNNTSSLKINDVVTFKNLSGYIVTHRIVGIVTDEHGGTAYHTKGDNPKNSVDQELLTPDRVLAKFILKIPLT